ncbi:hypothetical protein pb186bvf_002947 [Paramecium bursaria]
MSNPQIIYTVVVRGVNTILSEYATAGGNFVQFVKNVIGKVNSQNAKKSFNYDQYEFHLLVENGFSFLIMSEKGYKLRIAFAALEDIKNVFFKQFTPTVRDGAIAYGLNDQFSKVQKTKVEFYNSAEADKIKQIQEQVQKTNEIMMENLDKLLERGEKIDILVQKTQIMVNISTDMKNNATTLRRQMWWRNKKMGLILCLLITLGVYFLVSFICGFTFKKC